MATGDEVVVDRSRWEGAPMTEHAAKVAPDIYRVLFENDQVRLLEVTMPPGAASAAHSHPGYLVYVLDGGVVTLTAESGERAQVELAPGMSMWRDAEVHSAENTGSQALRALFFELK
jgi:quercetin dioxygenase-like cupin family protein